MSVESLIKLNGSLTIADFMNYAMFNEKTGYYRVKKPIGKSQDFITAPEISSVFGELIAIYFLNFIIESKKEISFVEMGSGNGTLFFDIITTFFRIAKKLGIKEKIQNINFNIVEISEELTKIQKETLKNLDLKIKWHKSFDEFLNSNQNRQIYFIANELFDCFEIHQFAKENNRWQEILVSLKNEKLTLILEEFTQEKHYFIEKIAQENEITNNLNQIIFEHSFKAQNFINQLSSSIKKQGGIAIIIDYGYYNSPLKSTLQAIKSHEKQDIFQDISNCDLTSLVNFKMLERCAKNHQLQTSLVNQSKFLTSLGIKEKENAILNNYNTNLNKNQVKSAINRLIDKNEMGELFKCLIIWDNIL